MIALNLPMQRRIYNINYNLDIIELNNIEH